MIQNVEQNVRTREEAAAQFLKDCGYRTDHQIGFFSVIALLLTYAEKAENRGAAEQRRKDAEGSRSVHQWRLSADDEWVNAVDLVELEQVRNGYPNSETRTLYTRAANVAALEAEMAKLRAENKRIRTAAEQVCSVREPASIYEARIALRAALTHEGGMP